jgi:RNA polymerase-binding transcription factor
VAAKKQAKTTKKKTTKRSTVRAGSKTGSKKSVTRTSKKAGATKKPIAKKTTKKKVARAAAAKTTGKKAKTTRKPAATKKVAKKKTTAKKTTAKKTTAKKTSKKTVNKKSTTRTKAATTGKKSTSKETTSKKTTTKKSSGKSKAAPEQAPGTRQLSQAVTPGSKPTLTLTSTSQEEHTRAADTGAGDSLIPPAAKKPRRRKMHKRDLEKYRTLLKAKRAELYGDVKTMRSDVLGNKSSGNLSNTPQHMADQGTDNYEQEFTLGLVEFERRLLSEIDEALGRIADGTYGICELTGRPISAARLQAKPWAKYCIDAARQLEQAGRR